MMRQVSGSSGDYCVSGRSSCFAEDGRLAASHFDLCSTKFYPSLPPQRSRQMCVAYLTPPAPVSPKSTSFQREDCHVEPRPQAPAGLQENEKAKDCKKKAAPGRSGKRGRPTGTTKLAGYRTSTGRPLGTTKAAGFKTSPGRPLGTTKAAGYKVSPGRPPGSIRSQSRLGKLGYTACSGAAFPFSIMHKPGACEDEETKEPPKMSIQAPQFLLSGFPIRTPKTLVPISVVSSEAFSQAVTCPADSQSRNSLALPLHSALPSYS
ncbi:UPF0461 protein C5orf24 homolog [Triplophysa rosa]|uniref:UPF0461 protein C5orf24-like protein n=1 Tax=Triplophysa rosa TaxID=992332 RepID=A0A9W7TCG5_TRIRA|nr:UPF0461 protein C5orf24 homolog [Triplophysa rosa]XP_057217190.1 UPF0461 protein C5orf24 homolog [Triplophysa rosa]XP_057217191.1 UPF0461 protein C5orf24 homolog [Triplophysa rosa]XP_057217192.1 UPF0461 protein C5orf24 homolog [Triplophysa rosa]KAI7795973.1 UPF0461 protein C5orf24-like protein [Triplophysa rosa]